MALKGLAGQSAVVTGAAGGIGAAVARRLVSEGARVTLVDLDAAAVEKVASELDGQTLAVGADVSTEEGVAEYMDRAAAAHGHVRLLHLNAGYAGRLAELADSDVTDFDRVIAVNVRGVYLGLRAGIRAMRRHQGGSIVASASTASSSGAQLWGPYVGSKHAVVGLVRAAALETARKGIRINAVCPSIVDTAMVRPNEDSIDSGDRAAARALIANALPVGRYAEPAELAAAVAWLLSEEASYATGGVFSIDGGISATSGFGYRPD